MSLDNIVDSIIRDSYANKDDLVKLLNTNNYVYLFNKADYIRRKICGEEIHIRGIIEFSNYCRCQCKYCGINLNNKKIKRYRMTVDEIVSVAKEATLCGYKTIVLQSGEDLYYDRDMISYLVKKIKGMGAAVTLSIGERSYSDYKQWREDGADRFLLKHETADIENYNYFHPHSNFKNRLECLYNLKELGYQVGSGFMIGLPNQTVESIAEDILLLKKLDVDMAGIGIFIPHPETKLKRGLENYENLTVNAVALTRILLKRPHLPATTSLLITSGGKKLDVFKAGANVIMQKLEPFHYQQLYEIYPNKCIPKKSIQSERLNIERYLDSIGEKVSKSKGNAVIM